MNTYYFVGSHSMVGSTVIDSYGQMLKLSDEDAEQYRKGGCALLSEEQFASLGHTKEELVKYDKPFKQIQASAEFLAKRDLAWKLFGDIYQNLHTAPKPESPKTPEPAEVEPVIPEIA